MYVRRRSSLGPTELWHPYPIISQTFSIIQTDMLKSLLYVMMTFIHFFWLHHNDLTVFWEKEGTGRLLLVKSSFSTIHHRGRGNCGGYSLWNIPSKGGMMGVVRFSISPVLDSLRTVLH